jgi:hypothetical protein
VKIVGFEVLMAVSMKMAVFRCEDVQEITIGETMTM